MKVQDIFTSIAKSSCCALCIAKYVLEYGLEHDGIRCLDSDLMMSVIKGWRKSYIDDDGTVNNATAYMKLIDPLHRTWEYDHVDIKSLADIPEGKTYPTFFSINGKSGHFVLANNKGVEWNPLQSSRNVEQGTPRSYRKITCYAD